MNLDVWKYGRLGQGQRGSAWMTDGKHKARTHALRGSFFSSGGLAGAGDLAKCSSFVFLFIGIDWDWLCMALVGWRYTLRGSIGWVVGDVPGIFFHPTEIITFEIYLVSYLSP